MKKLIFPCLLFSLLMGCNKEDSVDVNQDKIYTDYEMFYNANSDKTVVIARFRFGDATGTVLELSDGAHVLYNTDTLTYNNLYAGHAKEYAGEVTAGTFKYVDVNGDVYNNTVSSTTNIDFEPHFDTIVKSQANTLTWVGSPLGANEYVSVFIGSWTWGQDALAVQNQVGSTNIVLGVNQLSNLAIGGSTVYMDRVEAHDVTEGTSKGGRIRSRYRPANQSVQIVP